MAALLLSILVSGPASAVPIPIEARVVWTRGDRVYVASPESLPLEKGSLLTFMSRGKLLATGEVSSVVDDALAIAQLKTGSPMKERKLERIRVLFEPPVPRVPAVLRVGFPRGDRSNPFGCDHDTLRPPVEVAGYRLGPASGVATVSIWVHDPADGLAGPWPDTLAIHVFNDITDEEIALERGELDVAVFWPGELSRTMRELPRWKGYVSGTMRRGVMAAIPRRLSNDPAADAATSRLLSWVNQARFRGDFGPWKESLSDAESLDTTRGREAEPSDERMFATQLDRLRLAYLDAPVDEVDSLAIAVAHEIRRGPCSGIVCARADSLAAEVSRLSAAHDPRALPRLREGLRDSLGVRLAFTIRCPVLCVPELRPFLRALGPDAIVNIQGCRPGEGQP